MNLTRNLGAEIPDVGSAESLGEHARPERLNLNASRLDDLSHVVRVDSEAFIVKDEGGISASKSLGVDLWCGSALVRNWTTTKSSAGVTQNPAVFVPQCETNLPSAMATVLRISRVRETL